MWRCYWPGEVPEGGLSASPPGLTSGVWDPGKAQLWTRGTTVLPVTGLDVGWHCLPKKKTETRFCKRNHVAEKARWHLWDGGGGVCHTQIRLYCCRRNWPPHKESTVCGTTMSTWSSPVFDVEEKKPWNGAVPSFVDRLGCIASFSFWALRIVPESRRTWKRLLEISVIPEMNVNVTSRSEMGVFILLLVNPFKKIRKTERELSLWGLFPVWAVSWQALV